MCDQARARTLLTCLSLNNTAWLQTSLITTPASNHNYPGPEKENSHIYNTSNTKTLSTKYCEQKDEP